MTETRIIIRRSEVKSVRAVMSEYRQLCEARPLFLDADATPHQALAFMKEWLNHPISIDVLVNVLNGSANTEENEGVRQIRVYISELRVVLHIYIQLWHILHQKWEMTKSTMIEALMDGEGLPKMPLQLPSASIIIE